MSTACCLPPPASPLAFAAGSAATLRVGSAGLARSLVAPGSALLVRLWRAMSTRLQAARADWRALQDLHERRRAVAHLDARLRRDVGMGEFAAEPPAPDWVAIERARW